jgi:hypothetical protein
LITGSTKTAGRKPRRFRFGQPVLGHGKQRRSSGAGSLKRRLQEGAHRGASADPRRHDRRGIEHLDDPLAVRRTMSQ